MLAAEKRYEYQMSYNKYGIDMHPKTEYRKSASEKSQTKSLTIKVKVKLISYVVCLGVVAIAIILLGAYAANLKFETNRVALENKELQREIERLNVEIGRNTNIASIEERAINEFGMTYVTPEQIVYIEKEKEISQDFAMVLKEHAYNSTY